jgi:hypothetical protein
MFRVTNNCSDLGAGTFEASIWAQDNLIIRPEQFLHSFFWKKLRMWYKIIMFPPFAGSVLGTFEKCGVHTLNTKEYRI